MTLNQTFAFIGAGNMSGAILTGMVNAGVPATQIYATNRSKEKNEKLHAELGVITNCSNRQAIEHSDVVILGVKPQMMLQMLKELVADGVDFSSKLVVTVAAGLNSQSYKDIIGNVRFIRTMPNTPSVLGLGMTGIYSASDMTTFDQSVIEQDKAVAETVFKCVGETVWLNEEAQIDAVAAISGSGPAYFFLFMEGLIEKAKSLGFSDEEAKLMVKQTAIGATTMAQQATIEVEQLRKNVTSPGGTTAEAIRCYEQNNLSAISADALDANIARAKELSQLS